MALVHVVYGVINGDGSSEARARADEIRSSILQDMDKQVPGPKFILGDLNASIHKLPPLHGSIQAGKIVDVGATLLSLE